MHLQPLRHDPHASFRRSESICIKALPVRTTPRYPLSSAMSSQRPMPQPPAPRSVVRVLVETPAGAVPLESFLGALFVLALKQTEERVPDSHTSLPAQPRPLDTARAAEFFGISKQTMAKWRLDGNGPPYMQDGWRGALQVEGLERVALLGEGPTHNGRATQIKTRLTTALDQRRV